ncbi:nitroreductase [Paludibacter sp. 221]|uniref:nitroreductase family protein n=1 Tax=Paludibacter sp. 221 TaxID=2302939 RepID=UPI0013D0ABCB|nr:nitroreductase family protein [Paludibacter sp. 221]NDV47294.1 nitroreductase [Paludibacter sp. 221]
MGNLKSLLEKRFSVRSYQAKKVEREKIEYILECARLSPSAVNYQPWVFIIAQSDEVKTKMQESYNREWFAGADCYIVACGNHDEGWKRSDGKDFTDIDVSIACTSICLAAEETGLGTCWVGNFDKTVLRRNLELPEYIEPIAVFPLGYPAGDLKIAEKKRKTPDNIVKWK